jgi:hypothetical protein
MNKLVFILISIFVFFAITSATSCDCNSEAIRICGTHPTFVATACRNNARDACTKRCAAPAPVTAPKPVPVAPAPAPVNPCDCYTDSINKCGPHSVENIPCRQQSAEECNTRCPSTSCDCAGLAVQRCGTIPTFIGTTCRTIIQNDCTARCTRPVPVPRQPTPINDCDCNAEAIRKCGNHGTFIATACRNNAKNACNVRCTPKPVPVAPAPAPVNPCDCYTDSINKCGPHSVQNIPCRQQSAEQCNIRCPSTSCDCAGLAVQRCGTVPTFIGTTCRTIVQNNCNVRCAPKPVPVAPAPAPVNPCDCYTDSIKKCGSNEDVSLRS